jgi:hypothetical protein
MKKILLFILGLFIYCIVIGQGVAINTTGAVNNSSAILDISSTIQGTLITRMTQTQRNAIVTPATGLIIYQLDNNPGFYYYDGVQWLALGSTSLYANAYVAYSTGAITTGATWQVIPGMSVTFTIPSGINAKVILIGNVGIITSGAVGGTLSCTDVAIYKNDVLITNGGYVRVTLGDPLLDADENNLFHFPTISAIESLTSGIYTYDMRAWQQCTGGSTRTAIVGGDSTSVLQGTLIVIILYQ